MLLQRLGAEVCSEFGHWGPFLTIIKGQERKENGNKQSKVGMRENPQQPARTVEAHEGQERAGAAGRSQFKKGFVEDGEV